jgi:hypothetical protein
MQISIHPALLDLLEKIFFGNRRIAERSTNGMANRPPDEMEKLSVDRPDVPFSHDCPCDGFRQSPVAEGGVGLPARQKRQLHASSITSA